MPSTALKEATDHVMFSHENSDGYITIAKKDKASGTFRQYHYRTPEELANNLNKWIGDDVFFSQNTFYKPRRRIENIRQLRSLYVDLDFYIFNYDPEWIVGKLEHEYFGQTIPEPNIIIFSGQGVVLIWLIDPIPYKALPLWQAVEQYLLDQLKDLGGDPRATDAARIFRIAGSRNTKNGAFVHTEYRHDHRYDIHQIQYDYLPELTPKKAKKTKRGRKKKIVQLFNIYSLHIARVQDLHKLIDLRQGDMTGTRETVCFLYRYWMCCFTEDPEESLQSTIELNNKFTEPLTKKEVEKATKSAEKAWASRSNKEADKIAKEKGYPGAGYNVSNSKLIDWLQITQEEMEHLSTIINAKEKNRRRRVKYQEQEGKMSREEYIQQEKKKTMNRREQVKEALSQNPKLSNRKLATLLGISEAYIRKIKKHL